MSDARPHLPVSKSLFNLPRAEAIEVPSWRLAHASDDAAVDVMVTLCTLCDRFWRFSVSNCHPIHSHANHAIACPIIIVLQAF
jgi:hypothetical protein